MKRGLLVALALLAGCGESAPPDLAATRAEIDRLVRAFHDDMNRGNLDAVVPNLDPEFSIEWNGEEPVYGRDNAVEALRGFIDYNKGKDLLGKRKLRFGEIRVRQEGNVAVATYTVALLEPPDKPPFEETYTQVFKRSSGKWLFWHDHRSARK